CNVPDAGRGYRMIQAPGLPLLGSLMVGALRLGGALIALVGSVGRGRLGRCPRGRHASTLARPLGAGGILLGSMVCFSLLGERLVVHEVLIAVFLTVTTPVGLMLLARAALYRNREEAGLTPADEYRLDE